MAEGMIENPSSRAFAFGSWGMVEPAVTSPQPTSTIHGLGESGSSCHMPHTFPATASSSSHHLAALALHPHGANGSSSSSTTGVGHVHINVMPDFSMGNGKAGISGSVGGAQASSSTSRATAGTRQEWCEVGGDSTSTSASNLFSVPAVRTRPAPGTHCPTPAAHPFGDAGHHPLLDSAAQTPTGCAETRNPHLCYRLSTAGNTPPCRTPAQQCSGGGAGPQTSPRIHTRDSAYGLAHGKAINSKIGSGPVALKRWHAAVRRVMAAACVRRMRALLTHPTSSPSTKFYAAVQLMRLPGSAATAATAAALLEPLLLIPKAGQRAGSRASGPAEPGHSQASDSSVGGEKQGWLVRARDQVEHELFITGARLVEWFRPGKLNHHFPLFTLLFFCAFWILFFFMAGNFPFFVARGVIEKCASGDDANGPACYRGAILTNATSPRYMIDWVTHSGRSDATLSFDFMREWGGRYSPDLESGQWWRWLTSQFVHLNMWHIASNTAMFLPLGLIIERKYGTPRVTLIWVMAVLGGNFFSAALEDPCTQVVGASGGIFGLLGIFVADLVLNPETIHRPVLQGTMITVIFAFFLYNIATQSSVSHMSHLGGLLCGLLPAFLLLPNLKRERWEMVLLVLGGACILGVYVVLPLWLYLHAFKDMTC